MTVDMATLARARAQEARGPELTFRSGDRIRSRRGWYGVVVEDAGALVVRVRYDDGTHPVWAHRMDLRLVAEAADPGLQALIADLRHLRADDRMGAHEVRVLDQAIESIAFGHSDKALRLRLASELDRMIEQVEKEPFEEEINSQPRVRQWFAAGGRWTLQQMRSRVSRLREDGAAAAGTTSRSPRPASTLTAP